MNSESQVGTQLSSVQTCTGQCRGVECTFVGWRGLCNFMHSRFNLLSQGAAQKNPFIFKNWRVPSRQSASLRPLPPGEVLLPLAAFWKSEGGSFLVVTVGGIIWLLWDRMISIWQRMRKSHVLWIFPCSVTFEYGTGHSCVGEKPV